MPEMHESVYKSWQFEKSIFRTEFFLYGFFEFTSRSGILHEFKSGNDWLEEAILDYYNFQIIGPINISGYHDGVKWRYEDKQESLWSQV